MMNSKRPRTKTLHRITISRQRNQSPDQEEKKGPTIRSHKKKIRQPELFDLVIGALGRADVFDGDSLKALRLCSKAMKFLVDDSKVLTKFDFRRGRGNYDEFSEFLVHPDAPQHLQTLILYGRMDFRNASRFIMASPPGLKKLCLEKCGDALEVLLCGNYPQLTSLDVAQLHRACDISSILKEGARSWPLVELSLENAGGSFQNFADALIQFSGLRKLKLESPRFFGDAAVLQGSPQHLEDLSIISYSYQSTVDIEKLGFFNANGPTLPSIRKFTCFATDGLNPCLAECPWLKNVIDLRLTCFGTAGQTNIDALFMNLDGGMVETMNIRGCIVDADTFSRIDLPCLKEITFGGCIIGGEDILECMAAGGGLPLLESLTIDISRDADPLNFAASRESVAAFAAAHPRLTKFSIANVPCDAAALQQLSALLLPQLEEIEFKACTAMGFGDLVAALLTGAKNDDHDCGGGGGSMDEEEEEDENVAWPNLRILRVSELSGPFTYESYENILALAPLCRVERN